MKKKGFEHARKCPSKVITKKFQDRIKKAERSDFFLQTFGTIVALWNLNFSNMFQYHY